MSYTDEESYFGKKMMHIVIEPKKLTCDTVNSLIATTSRKRPPSVSVAVLLLSQILFQKLSRKRPLLEFLNQPRPLFRPEI